MRQSLVERDALIKTSQASGEREPHRPGAPGLVAVLSADGVFTRELEEHVQHAGFAVRAAVAVGAIVALKDPASLMLVLVDPRVPDWDMLRTDPSFRHVLLMGVVPLGWSYTEDHSISDLERGMDGLHDLREGFRLLLVKIQAYLRRAGCDTVRRGVYRVGAVVLDEDAHEVTIAGRQVNLSAKPFALLAVLMREPSKVFSRSELLKLVWGPGLAVGAHALDVHVHALRQELHREPHRLCELVTIKRIGFKLKPVSSAGSIRTRWPRPSSNIISGSPGRSRMMPRFTSHRISSLSDQQIKPQALVGMTSAGG